jgi:magnesium transporter
LCVEQAFGVAIPTREEMQEIEASSRLYMEKGAHYMTAVVLHQRDGIAVGGLSADERREVKLADIPQAAPVTFVIANNRLVTVRYDEPRAFPIFLARNQKGDLACGGGGAVLVGLIETIIDREADRVERMQAEVDRLGHSIFGIRGDQTTQNRRFDLAIRAIGREGEVTSRSRESLQSLDRLLTYLPLAMGVHGDDAGLRARIKTADRDVESLRASVDYVSNKVQFLLDATLGLIGMQQNNIIKFFTVVSVALMPPTLVASLYGMNFKQMPELEWTYGYPMAICLMIVSAVVPFLYFKRKGWM